MSKKKNKMQRERFYLKKAKQYIELMEPAELEELKKKLESQDLEGLPRILADSWSRCTNKERVGMLEYFGIERVKNGD